MHYLSLGPWKPALKSLSLSLSSRFNFHESEVPSRSIVFRLREKLLRNERSENKEIRKKGKLGSMDRLGDFA